MDKKPNQQKTMSNKGGTVLQKPIQQRQQNQKKQNKKPQVSKNVQAFSGQGVKVDSDDKIYNWICDNCGYINKISVDEKCRICQYVPNFKKE